MRTSLFILFFSLACIRLTAQNDTWTYFTPPPGINSLAAQGNTILTGTNGAGIVRFDTLDNRSYFNADNSGMPSDTILQLAIDAEGNWWIQHPGGISRFDGATAQTWTLAQTGLPANAAIRALKAAVDSSLYVATDNGVAIFKGGAWSVLNTTNSGLPTNNVWDVAFGPGDGKRYFATTGNGVVVQDGATWTSYTSTNTGVSNLNNIFSVAVTTEGVLWAIGGFSSTTSIRLAKMEAGAWTGYTAVSIGIGTPAPPLRKVVAGSAGRLILTTTSTVSILQQGVWAHYNRDEIGCSPDGSIAPAEDGAGRIWVHTACDLARFDGQVWSLQSTELPGTPGGILYDGIGEGADGSIWLGAEFGRYIARLTTANTWERHFPVDHGASANDVYSVQAAPDGAMWFGLDSAQILRYSNGEWTLFDTCTTHFPGHFVLTSAGAPNGDRWFSFFRVSPTSSGLARYSADGQWQFFTPANSPMPLAYTRKILIEANGTAWFTTANANRGILRYNGATWDSITVSNSGLPSNRVNFLAQAPDGAIWAATSAGLARYDGQNWTVLNTSNSGLPSNLVARVAFDQAGGMYVGYAPEPAGAPGARVVVLRGGVWTELIPPNWTNSFQDEPDAFFVDSQNRFWFAKLVDNFGGVYRYDPMLVGTGENTLREPVFSVYPNPATDLILLKMAVVTTGDAWLRVSNLQGQMVYAGPVTDPAGQALDMSRWPSGMYLFTVSRGSGFSTIKVVKE